MKYQGLSKKDKLNKYLPKLLYNKRLTPIIVKDRIQVFLGEIISEMGMYYLDLLKSK